MSKSEEVETFRQLPVVLTGEERAQRALRLASLHREKDDLEKTRRDHANTINEKLKEVDAEMRALVPVVETGREHRTIKIEHRKNFENRKIETFRLDTNEVIDSRQLAIDEMQDDLPFDRESGERHTSYKTKSNVVPIQK